jgi:hypothetical protein
MREYKQLTEEERIEIYAIFVIVGFVFVIITLLWVNLSRIFAGMHNYA